MDRTWPLLAALALFGAGCPVENQNSLVVLQDQVVDRTTTMCAVPTTATITSRSQGTLDVALAEQGLGGYDVVPLLRNDLLPRADPQNGVPETDTIQLTGADVQLSAPVHLSANSFFVQSFGGTIDPGATGSMVITVIPETVAKADLAPVLHAGDTPIRVIAHFRVHGSRSGGDITSGWVDFPIDVCRNCLTGPIAACPNPPPSKASINLGGCFPAQDDPISCCTNNGATLCGANFPTSGM